MRLEGPRRSYILQERPFAAALAFDEQLRNDAVHGQLEINRGKH